VKRIKFSQINSQLEVSRCHYSLGHVQAETKRLASLSNYDHIFAAHQLVRKQVDDHGFFYAEITQGARKGSIVKVLAKTSQHSCESLTYVGVDREVGISRTFSNQVIVYLWPSRCIEVAEDIKVLFDGSTKGLTIAWDAWHSMVILADYQGPTVNTFTKKTKDTTPKKVQYYQIFDRFGEEVVIGDKFIYAGGGVVEIAILEGVTQHGHIAFQRVMDGSKTRSGSPYLSKDVKAGEHLGAVLKLSDKMIQKILMAKLAQ
jgi:hypothetical protein